MPTPPMTSFPARGAWIEITSAETDRTPSEGRSPQGERGLKLTTNDDYSRHLMSFPARGAWIEIKTSGDTPGATPVVPRKGSVD